MEVTPTLELEGVVKTFEVRGQPVRALQGVGLQVRPGEAVGLIGESGSGKTTLGRVALGIVEADSGSVRFEGKPWSDGGPKVEAARRGGVSIVFQNPAHSLNPRLTVGASVLEPIDLHRRDLGQGERRELAEQALALAQLPVSLWGRYPRQLSGGQQQRVAIARAIAIEPRLIVLDEPTAALDAAVRRGILATLAELRERLSISYLLITHDMTTVTALAERTVVLYRGVVVEEGPTAQVLDEPAHPYTKALMSAVLTVDADADRWYRLSGRPSVPDATQGCVLYGRCPEAADDCLGSAISVRAVSPGHTARCVRVDEAPVSVNGVEDLSEHDQEHSP